MLNVDFFTMTINNSNILYQTFKHLNENIKDLELSNCDLYLNVDPHPNKNNIEDLINIAKKFFKNVIINIPDDCNSGKAFKWGINQFKKEYLFIIEANKCINKEFSIKNMIDKFSINENIVEVCLSPKRENPFLKYLTTHPSLWEKKWLKKINVLLSENLNYEYQLRELALLEKKIGYTLSNPNNIYLNHIGKKYKEEKKYILANSSMDNQIEEIILKNGEWHKNIYNYFVNELNKNEIMLKNFKKKILDKEWIYRWTGNWKYVDNNKIYLRYLKPSRKYLCNN